MEEKEFSMDELRQMMTYISQSLQEIYNIIYTNAEQTKASEYWRGFNDGFAMITRHMGMATTSIPLKGNGEIDY